MELRQIEAFLAVVHAGSFTGAAERLNLAQPSLSARIQQLERALDGELFVRSSRPVRLTAMGEIFLPYAERALEVLEIGQKALTVAQIGLAGRLAVGSPVSVATYLMPAVVDLFSHRYPQAELFIETSHSSNLVQQLEDGILDLVFTAVLPHLIRQADILLRLRDQMVVAASPGHPLIGRGELTPDDLWPHRVILPRWGAPFETYVGSLREAHPQPRPLVRAPLAVAQHMLLASEAVTFIPRRVAQAIQATILPVPEFHYPWDVVLITRLGHTLNPLEKGFLETVQQAAAADS